MLGVDVPDPEGVWLGRKGGMAEVEVGFLELSQSRPIRSSIVNIHAEAYTKGVYDIQTNVWELVGSCADSKASTAKASMRRLSRVAARSALSRC